MLSSLRSDTFSYLLPDERAKFDYQLETHLKHTDQEVLIITHSMNYPSLKKMLLKSLSRGNSLILITNTAHHDPSNIIAYQGVELYLYRPRLIMNSTIIIDSSYACHLSGSLDESKMSQTAQSVICSDEAGFITQSRNHFGTFLERSQTYLK